MPKKIFLVEGDRKPDITFTLRTGDGQPMDLSSGLTVARFRYRQIGSNSETPKVGTIDLTKTTDGTDGKVTLAWGVNDLDTPGDFEAEIQVFFDSVKHTAPDLIPFQVRPRIRPDVDSLPIIDDGINIPDGAAINFNDLFRLIVVDGELVAQEFQDPDWVTVGFLDLTGYARMDTNQTWTGAQRGAYVELTSTAASIAVDLDLSNNFNHTLTEDTTLAAPTNAVAGQSGVIHFTQHASAAKTLAFNAFWQFGTTDTHTITTTLSGTAVMSYIVDPAGTSATCSWVNKS